MGVLDQDQWLTLKNKRVNNPNPKVHILYLKVLPVKYNELQTVLSYYCDFLLHHVWDEVWLYYDSSLIIYEMYLFSDKHHYFYSFITMLSLSVDLLNQVICVSKKYLTAKKRTNKKSIKRTNSGFQTAAHSTQSSAAIR